MAEYNSFPAASAPAAVRPAPGPVGPSPLVAAPCRDYPSSMLRRALVLAVVSLVLSACENSERSADDREPSRPDIAMPSRSSAVRRQAAVYRLSGGDEATVPLTRASLSYAPVDTPRRADDSLPSAFGELSGLAVNTGRKIASTADKIVVEKAAHRLTLYRGNTVLASYPIGLGDAYGDKFRQGDRRTPEGEYFIIQRKGPGETNFHRAFLINYPNEEDVKRGKTGGLIEIHGLGPYYASLGTQHYLSDWTVGCMALTDKQMDDIWDAVPLGTRIIIKA